MRNRRKFLKQLSMGTLAATFFPFRLRGESNLDCQPTTSDILGPFFLDGAPEIETIVPEGFQGDRLFLSGTVFSDDCETPLENAILDFWQADSNGGYDLDGFNFRAKIITGINGNYNLETIVPGKYLNGSQFRPSHIHLKVKVEGYEELVTQIYFHGDSDIASDPWASSPSAVNRIISLNSGFAGHFFGNFDVFMSPIGSIGLNNVHIEYGDLTQNFPNPFFNTTKLFLVLNHNALCRIEIFNLSGNQVKVLLNQKMSKGRYELNWDASSHPNGIYTLIWSIDNKQVKTIKMIKQGG